MSQEHGHQPSAISHQPSPISHVVAPIVLALVVSASTAAAQTLPELTQPVNDFAHVIDPDSAARMDSMIREMQEKTGDAVVVATVPTVEPFGTVKEYVVKLFENHGRGIGQKGKDNGILILLAMKETRVEIEVGYDLEQWVTDGFAGQTSREVMAPLLREGRYGEGLLGGTERVVSRIAQGRGVTLTGVRTAERRRSRDATPIGMSALFWIFIAILIISRIGGGRRRRRFWGGSGGWSSGVGPFGGGFGGGFGGFSGGGGGFGGGFGGFGGGRSGGGGGGASW
jgi:uncharacterized protein